MNITRLENGRKAIEYDYVEFTAILALMFIPLTNTGNILRLAIVSIFLFKRLIRYRFLLLINDKITRILITMLIGMLSPVLVVVLMEQKFNYSLWSHEIIRLLFYMLLLIEVPKIRISFKYVYMTAIAVLLFNTGIQILQKIGLFGINIWLRRVYTDPSATTTHLVTTEYLGSGFRSGSIFINPNVYMVIPCIILCVFLQKNIIKSHIINYLLSILAIVSMLLTGSRTCLVVGAAVVFMYLMSNKTIDFREKIIVFTVSIIALIYMFMETKLTSNFRIFDISNGIERSLFAKLRNFVEYIRLANPIYLIFGGIGSDASSIQIDAEWGYIIQYYGMIGIAWYTQLVIKDPVIHQDKMTFFVKSTKLVVILIALSATVVFCMPIYPYICLLLLSQIY